MWAQTVSVISRLPVFVFPVLPPPPAVLHVGLVAHPLESRFCILLPVPCYCGIVVFAFRSKLTQESLQSCRSYVCGSSTTSHTFRPKLSFQFVPPIISSTRLLDQTRSTMHATIVQSPVNVQALLGNLTFPLAAGFGNFCPFSRFSWATVKKAMKGL